MDIDKLISNLKNIKEELDTNGELDMDILHIAKYWSKDISDAIEALERNNADWIPCSERLPREHKCKDGEYDPSDYVLIIRKNGQYGVSRYWNHRHSKDNVNFDKWIDLAFFAQDVVAWMPLPKSI